VTFQGALIKEQGVTFAVVIVKQRVLDMPSDAGEFIASYQATVFPGIPVVLMAQNASGIPAYYGRRDIVRFLARVPLGAVPWREFTLS
jgi:hypothetical protein